MFSVIAAASVIVHFVLGGTNLVVQKQSKIFSPTRVLVFRNQTENHTMPYDAISGVEARFGV